MTATLLLWQKFGMNRVLQIDTNSQYPIQVNDDRSEGGASVGIFSRSKNGLVLDCVLKTKYEWLYCEIIITLTGADKGIDLSNFDVIKLNK